MEEGRKERLPEALQCFDKSLQICNDINFGTSRIKALIADARSELSEDYDHNELIELHQKGESSADTIKTGLDLATALKHTHHGIRAEEMVSELYRRGRLSLGEDHHVTQNVFNSMRRFLSRIVSLRSENG